MEDRDYMRMALGEAEKAAALGEIPVGAVIVSEGNIIATAHNMRESWQDATAHAEIIAIREACAKLKSWRLSDCTLYVTVEPCSMCSGAIVNSRLGRVVYGCPDSKAGGAESIFNIINNANLNHRSEVVRGVCEEECAAIIKKFFHRRRRENKDDKRVSKG